MRSRSNNIGQIYAIFTLGLAHLDTAASKRFLENVYK